jgi:hypothetical protein
MWSGLRVQKSVKSKSRSVLAAGVVGGGLLGDTQAKQVERKRSNGTIAEVNRLGMYQLPVARLLQSLDVNREKDCSRCNGCQIALLKHQVGSK